MTSLEQSDYDCMARQHAEHKLTAAKDEQQLMHCMLRNRHDIRATIEELELQCVCWKHGVLDYTKQVRHNYIN